MSLASLGWNAQFAAHFQSLATPGSLAARVAAQHKHACRLLVGSVECDGICTGRLLHECTDLSALPVVGDWVVARPRPGETVADIHAVLPRQSAFTRRAAGSRRESQVLAANLDTVFLVMALDGNFNLRRLERLLVLTRESGATPIVVLNKLDLCADPERALREAAVHARGTEVLAISALRDAGLDAVRSHLSPGGTIAVLGSSGVGKSTLVNHLLGEERQRTTARRDDNSLGRHTTVHRELLRLPGGALIIDTPGLREVGLWDAGAGIDETFADIATLAARCRFNDCTHDNEPGCAVRAALENGDVEADRLAAWLKLAREQAWHERRENRAAAAANKRVWKQRTIEMRRRQRFEGDG